MKLSDILLLLKGGKRGVVGEIRTWANGKRMKKTVDKWVEVNEHGQPKEKKAKAEPKKKKETPVKKEKKPAAKKKFSDSEIKVKAEKVKKKLKEAKPKKEKAVKKETKKEAPKQEPIQKENKDEPKTENKQDYKTNGVKAKAFKSWFGDWEQAKQTGDYSNVSKVLNEKKEPQEMSSVMVDDEGNPLKMLHGTKGYFDEFHKDYATGGKYGSGFYFSENKDTTKGYRVKDTSANSISNTLSELSREASSLSWKLGNKQLNKVRNPFDKIQDYIKELKKKHGGDDNLDDIYQAEGELKDEINKIHLMIQDRIKEMNLHKDVKREHGEIKINPEVEEFVKDITSEKSHEARENNLKTVYLNIKKPFYIDMSRDAIANEVNISNLEKLGDKILLDAYKKIGGNIQVYAEAGRSVEYNQDENTEIQLERTYKNMKVFTDLLASKGFDGVITASFMNNGDIDRKKIFENNEVHKFKKHFNYDEVVAFEPNQIKSVDNSGDFNSKENNMYKAYSIRKARIMEMLLKGKRAAVGEIRNWKGGAYIKTATGWKPHEKKYSKKYTERKNNAATKKDTDLRKRQSEVARLSGEIQGHKAAVEHHTAQNTKQDTRQAKHHSIRAQVKQRRLDKHKEILEQRHGVDVDFIVPKQESKFPIPEGNATLSLPSSNGDKYILQKEVPTGIVSGIGSNKGGWEMFRIPKGSSKWEKLGMVINKDAAIRNIEQYAKQNNSDITGVELHSKPMLEEAKKPESNYKTKYQMESDIINGKPIDKNEFNKFPDLVKKWGNKNVKFIDNEVKSPEAKANFEKWKADRQEEKPKETAKATSEYDKLKKEFQEWQEKRKKPSEMTDYEAQRRLEQGRKFREKFDKLEKPTPPEQPKPKKDLIQSGSRGATIAGQQYSKREVDILNSLDEIIGRAKSPVVQDLLKKRQAAKIELPSKELGQPKLAAHESKFMELVGKNRSQADKQAGYPTERRKVEAETGVKIPREKAVEMTKHMKASFIWDIKKPSLIR